MTANTSVTPIISYTAYCLLVTMVCYLNKLHILVTHSHTSQFFPHFTIKVLSNIDHSFSIMLNCKLSQNDCYKNAFPFVIFSFKQFHVHELTRFLRMALETSATDSAYAEATTTYSEEKVELPEPHRKNRPLRGMLSESSSEEDSSSVEESSSEEEEDSGVNLFAAPTAEELDALVPEPGPEFRGVISCETFQDPVIDHEGSTYERSKILLWLETHNTSPITRNPLSVDDLIPNRNLKDAIEARKKVCTWCGLSRRRNVIGHANR